MLSSMQYRSGLCSSGEIEVTSADRLLYRQFTSLLPCVTL